MKGKAYAKYKPSGVDWLGDVPEHWEVKKARRCLIEHKQGYYTNDVYVDDGYKLLRITDLDGNGFIKTDDSPSVDPKGEAIQFLLKENDFVFARTGGAGTFGLVKNLKFKAVFASYLIRFRFNKDTYADFLRYMFFSKQFVCGIVRNIHGGVNQNVHAEDIKDQYICLPPLPQQHTIATILNRETGHIDFLIRKKQRLLELLKEKRTALISRAVTKGLDLSVKLKPSGVEWLGDIPEHWEVKRFKFILQEPLQYGANEAAELDDPDLPRFVRITDVDESGNLRDETFRSLPESIAKPFLLEEGDLLFARSGATVGKTFFYRKTWGRAAYAGYLIRARFKKNIVYPDYINFITKSNLYLQWISSILIQATIQNVSAEKYASYSIPIPPLKEQQAIADFLDRETAKIDTLANKVETAIERLKEYRLALISAAVTGKIDVREAS